MAPADTGRGNKPMKQKSPQAPARDKPAFECTPRNALPELMELTFYVPQGGTPQNFQLGVETRFGSMTIYMDDYEKHIEFGLSKAQLRLELHGCEIAQANRLGDLRPPRQKPKSG